MSKGKIKHKIKSLHIKTWFADQKKLPEKFECEIIIETEKAILIYYEFKEIWIPKSCIIASGSNIYQTYIDGWKNE